MANFARGITFTPSKRTSTSDGMARPAMRRSLILEQEKDSLGTVCGPHCDDAALRFAPHHRPYASDDAVYEAPRTIRTEKIPFMGTCGGMQYAVVEYLRNALGSAATRAESDGVSEDNAVAAAAIATLEAAGVVVGALAENAGAEVLDFSPETFYVTSMFQPPVGASTGRHSTRSSGSLFQQPKPPPANPALVRSDEFRITSTMWPQARS